MDLLTANDRPGEYPRSYYAATAETLPPFDSAKGALHCDVCIVGGGFTGLSSALHLAQRGYEVILLDAQRVGFGASGRNGGQVGQGQRANQNRLEAMVGREHARKLWDIARQSVDLVRQLARSDLIRAEFHDGIIHADHRQRFVKDSFSYAKKLKNEYGYDGIDALTRDELRHLVDSPNYYGGLLYRDAGHIDPLQLALGLARMGLQEGVRIFERSLVTNIRKGAPAIVDTAAAEIFADYVVLACNGYLGKLDRGVAAHVMPINNYVIATQPMSPQRQESLIRNNYAVADSRFVINYFRFSDDHRLIFGGTESYGYLFPPDIVRNVRKSMLTIFPQLKDVRIDYGWGGTLAITMNRMPHFQRIAGNILSMSGYSGHGVAMATLAGQIAAETIAGQAERFDVMAKVPTPNFPGGTMLRSPILALAMLWYSLCDRL